MTTELLLLRAIQRGLTVSDFEHLTIGMIFGYIVAHNNERLDEDERDDIVHQAGQSDFDRF